MQRFGSRDLYGNRAEAYNPGIAYLPVRTVKVRARKRITSMGLQYTEAAHERLFFKTVALKLSLVPKADFSAQYLRWGILVGEIVHNIGSALDNLVWELAQPLPPAPPPTASSKVRGAYSRLIFRLGFPYTKHRIDWASHCSRYLHFVPDRATRTLLEETQAFFAWEKDGTDPDAFPLEVIHELWNRDKHRTVNVATTGLQIQVSRVSIPSLFPSSGYLPSEVVKLFPLRPIIGETEMAVVHVHLPEEVEFPQSGELPLNVNVHPQYTLAILFGEGSGVEGLNALDTLLSAHQLATQVINKFS